jgi:hypothetical protein
LKNPLTRSGLETATFRLVAWCLNQLRNPEQGAYCILSQFSYTPSISLSSAGRFHRPVVGLNLNDRKMVHYHSKQNLIELMFTDVPEEPLPKTRLHGITIQTTKVIMMTVLFCK